MAGPGDIRAGGAYVELSAPDEKLTRDLQQAEGKVQQYGRSIRTLLAQADRAEGLGQSGRAAALRELAQRQTANQAQAMQSVKTAQRALVVDRAHAEAIVEDQQRTLQARRQAAAQLVVDQQDLEDRLFRAQATGKQIALRDLDRHFATLRARYQGNAKMLLLIERSYRAESLAISKEHSGGLLGALGGKKLVRKEMKYAASTVAGMHGGEVGLGIATLMSMSGTAIAIAAPLMMIGAAYQGATENAAKLAETQSRLNAATQHYKDLVEDLNRGDNTSTGSAAAQAAHEADLKAKEVDGLIRKAEADYGITAKLGDVWDALSGKNDGLTTLERQKFDMQAERRKHWERGDALRGLAGAEAQGMQLAKEADYGFKHRERVAGAMEPGMGQDVARLDIDRDRERFAIAKKHRSEWFAAWIIEDEKKKAQRMKEIDAERNKALEDLDEDLYYKRQQIRKKYEKEEKARTKEYNDINNQANYKLYTLTGDIKGGRVMAERKWEWNELFKKLTGPISEGGLGLDKNSSQVAWAKRLFEAGNAAQDTYPLTQQIEEIDRRLAVARGQMTQREASRQEILAQYPQANGDVVNKLLDRMTALNTQWTSMGTFSATEASRMGGGTGDLSAMRSATESVAKDMPRLIQTIIDYAPKFL